MDTEFNDNMTKGLKDNSKTMDSQISNIQKHLRIKKGVNQYDAQGNKIFNNTESFNDIKPQSINLQDQEAL